jgi:drug/metabolite transporter (DMT)-like permease
MMRGVSSAAKRNLVLSGLLLSVTAVWGWTFTVVKDAAIGYGVVSFLAIRFVVASVCLGAVGWKKVTRKSLAVGGVIGIALALGYLFQTFGLVYTTPTNSGLITGLFVVFAPVSSRLLFGIRTPRLLWGAIGLSLVGLAMLTGTGPSPLAVGDLLTLGAAVSFGLQIALLGHFARHHDTLALAVVQVVTATLIFLAAWPFVGPLAWPTGKVWLDILLTGVVATAVGFYVQTLAQKQLPATRAAIIFTSESVFAMIFGYLLAGDRLSAIQIAGAVLMIAAVGVGEIGPAVLRPANSE